VPELPARSDRYWQGAGSSLERVAIDPAPARSATTRKTPRGPRSDPVLTTRPGASLKTSRPRRGCRQQVEVTGQPAAPFREARTGGVPRFRRYGSIQRLFASPMVRSGSHGGWRERAAVSANSPIRAFMSRFDLTMSYRLNADVRLPYFGLRGRRLQEGAESESTPLAAMFISWNDGKQQRGVRPM